MKINNYNELLKRYEAYEDAKMCKYLHPENDEYHDFVTHTHSNLIDYIIHILWDEAPEELKPAKNPYDFELEI